MIKVRKSGYLVLKYSSHLLRVKYIIIIENKKLYENLPAYTKFVKIRQI